MADDNFIPYTNPIEAALYAVQTPSTHIIVLRYADTLSKALIGSCVMVRLAKGDPLPENLILERVQLGSPAMALLPRCVSCVTYAVHHKPAEVP